jgi:hypothetical protein
MGRASAIKKRTCAVNIILDEVKKEEKADKKAKPTKAGKKEKEVEAEKEIAK